VTSYIRSSFEISPHEKSWCVDLCLLRVFSPTHTPEGNKHIFFFPNYRSGSFCSLPRFFWGCRPFQSPILPKRLLALSQDKYNSSTSFLCEKNAYYLKKSALPDFCLSCATGPPSLVSSDISSFFPFYPPCRSSLQVD